MYSVTEASEKVGITIRAIQKRCKNEKIRKKSNRYLITDEHIDNWINERTENITKSQKYQFNEVVRLNETLKQEISDLKEQLKGFDIQPNERIEVFTDEDYNIFEQRLREWFTLQKDIEHKSELFDVEKKGLKELLEHYKAQFEYQKKQSSRILDQHQQLLDTIQSQTKITIQRQVIEAKEKDIINKDWKTN